MFLTKVTIKNYIERTVLKFYKESKNLFSSIQSYIWTK